MYVPGPVGDTKEKDYSLAQEIHNLTEEKTRTRGAEND